MVYGADRPLCKKEYVNEIEKLFFRYIWNGNIFKASFGTCCRSPESGGLGLMDPEKKCEALFYGRWMANSLSVESSVSADWLRTLNEFFESKGQKAMPKECIFLKRTVTSAKEVGSYRVENQSKENCTKI